MISELQGFNRYQKLDKIGGGSYGEVFKCKDLITQNIFAMKRITQEHHVIGICSQILREIGLLKNLQHPNIIKLIDQFVHNNSIYLILEYVSQNLSEFLLDENTLINDIRSKCLIKQLLLAVQKCHKANILHRDISPRNILINSEDQIKLADFGLARPIQYPLRPYTLQVVTLWYRAPEILLRCPIYSKEIDVWSIGCIFYEIITKQPLFQGDSDINQLSTIFDILGTPTSEYWPEYQNLVAEAPFSFKLANLQPLLLQVHGFAYGLIIGMLEMNPKKRITVDEALNHVFQQYHFNKPYFTD